MTETMFTQFFFFHWELIFYWACVEFVLFNYWNYDYNDSDKS